MCFRTSTKGVEPAGAAVEQNHEVQRVKMPATKISTASTGTFELVHDDDVGILMCVCASVRGSGGSVACGACRADTWLKASSLIKPNSKHMSF